MKILNINRLLTKKSWLLFLVGIVLLVSFFCESASAASFDLNAIERKFNTKAQHIQTLFKDYALKVFWMLAVIDLVWIALTNFMSSREFTDIFLGLGKFIVTIGFFFFLLTQGPELTLIILDSFQVAGERASGGIPLDPSGIFLSGIQIFKDVWSNTSLWSPVTSVFLAISAIIIIVIYALIAAYVALTLIEISVVLAGAMLLLGLGGSQITREFAINVYKYVLGVGFKLLTLYLLIGIGQQIMNEATRDLRNGAFEYSDVGVILGVIVFIYMLVTTLPSQACAVISGAAFSNMGGFTASAAAAGGFAGGMAGGVAGGALNTASNAAGALNVGMAQMKANPAASSMGQAGNFLKFSAGAAGNEVKAGLGRWLNGGNITAQNLNNKAREIRSQSEKPKNPEAE